MFYRLERKLFGASPTGFHGVSVALHVIASLMIFFLGIVIGTIVVAMYLPMFTLISKIG